MIKALVLAHLTPHGDAHDLLATSDGEDWQTLHRSYEKLLALIRSAPRSRRSRIE